MNLLTESFSLRVTPNKAVKIIKMSVFLTGMWLPVRYQSKMSFKLLMFFLIFTPLGLFFPLVFSIYKYFDNLLIVLKSLICSIAMLSYIIRLIIIRTYHREFKRLGSSLNEFIRKANESNQIVLQKYIDKCWTFQFFMICSYYVGCTGLIIGPLVLPQKFPTDAVYPFSVDNFLVSTIVYAHQGLAAYQYVSGMMLDGQAALFIWYLNAKFEILVSETKRVVNFEEMCWYIKKHQEILSFADVLIPPVRALAFTTISGTKLIMISCGFFLISDESLLVKIQFGAVAMCATLNTFLYSWAADNLMNISGEAMSNELFGMFERYSLKMKKMCLLIIHRTQKPVVINIPGFLDTISSEYYASFLSTAFSCFATVRVIVDS